MSAKNTVNFIIDDICPKKGCSSKMDLRTYNYDDDVPLITRMEQAKQYFDEKFKGFDSESLKEIKTAVKEEIPAKMDEDTTTITTAVHYAEQNIIKHIDEGMPSTQEILDAIDKAKNDIIDDNQCQMEEILEVTQENTDKIIEKIEERYINLNEQIIGGGKVLPTIDNTIPSVVKFDNSVTFEVSSTPNEYAGVMVKGKIKLSVIGRQTVTPAEFDNYFTLEYYETAAGMEGWRKFPIDEKGEGTFGPASGFPCMQATSQFRITAKRQECIINFTIDLVRVEDGRILVTNNDKISIVESTYKKTKAKGF